MKKPQEEPCLSHVAATEAIAFTLPHLRCHLTLLKWEIGLPEACYHERRRKWVLEMDGWFGIHVFTVLPLILKTNYKQKNDLILLDTQSYFLIFAFLKVCFLILLAFDFGFCPLSSQNPRKKNF